MKWSLFDNVPQWVWATLLSFGLTLLAVCIFSASKPKLEVTVAPNPRPAIYVTGRPEWINMDGTMIYSLEYTDSLLGNQMVNFKTVADRAKYEGWLYTIGDRVE